MELFPQFYESACKIQGDKNLILLTNKAAKISDSPECPIINVQHIDHLPWPLITLLKFHYLESVLDNCGDYVLYANSNFVFNEGLELELNNKVNLAYMDTDTYREYRTWPTHNEFNCDLRHVLGGFIYARKDLMHDVCKDIIWNVNRDMFQGCIRPLHDETALNQHYSRNVDKCQIWEIHTFGHLTNSLYTSGQRFKPFIPTTIKY